MDNRFEGNNYMIRKEILSILGAKFQIFDSNQQLILFSKMKAFKLKEDIRLYSGEDMVEELINIKARQILDISATYDVHDTKTQKKIGALRRKGIKSIIIDEWIILNENDEEIGSIKEDSLFLGLVRRFISNLIPQKYNIYINNELVGTYKHHFNPFMIKIDVEFNQDTTSKIDKRLGIAGGIIMGAIEGKQQ